jgi:hypothetical protein
MSIFTYQTLHESTLLRTLTKKDIAQYIFDNGLTQFTTTGRYSISGKNFIKMVSSPEQFYYINLNNTDERKIYLEISNKTFAGLEFINIEYRDGIISFFTSTQVAYINEDDNINICFKDADTDKVQILNAQPYNKRAIIYCIFKIVIKYMIIILQWISSNI